MGNLNVYTALPEQGCVVHVSAKSHQFAVETLVLPERVAPSYMLGSTRRRRMPRS